MTRVRCVKFVGGADENSEFGWYRDIRVVPYVYVSDMYIWDDFSIVFAIQLTRFLTNIY